MSTDQLSHSGSFNLLNEAEIKEIKQSLGKDWKIINDHHLEKDYIFHDFQKALQFTNQVAEIAEQEGHHPDILLSYGKATVRIWTHTIDGLSEADFILATKCDHVDTK